MSSLHTSSGGTGGNPDLEAMHRDLVTLVQRLEVSIDTAPDAAAIATINEQMVEVNARVTSIGRVLLAAQTEAIARHAEAVSRAIPTIEKEIENVGDRERVIRSVASLLGTVDKALRVATLGRG